MNAYLVNIFGILFLITSIFDAWKYRWSAAKIRRVGTSSGHSRQFINVALLNDIIRLSYGFSIMDWYIIASSLLAMVCMFELFFTMYLYYPYINKDVMGFQRPSIWIYLWNSILPNDRAERL